MARFAVGIVVVLLVQAALVGGLRAPGERLRPLVDLLAAEGLLLALVGALLAAERPFLAVRELRRRATEQENRVEPAGPDRSRRRRAGGLTLLGGAVLFGLAALLWAIGGGSGN